MVLSKKYIAGFFDGEGCISIYPKTLYDSRNKHRKKRLHLSLHVAVTNTDPKVIRELNRTIPGTCTVRRYKNHYLDLHTWMLTGGRAGKFLVMVRPFLIVKAAQADVAIKFANTMREPLVPRGKVGGAFLSRRVETIRQRCYEQLHAAKTKGRKPRMKRTRIAGEAIEFHWPKRGSDGID